MESPSDELGSPQAWPSLDSTDSLEHPLTLHRTSMYTKSLTTPPRSRSSSTSTPPRQPRKFRYKRSSQFPADCPAEAALQSLLESTHIFDSSPKRQSQSTVTVKSLFFVPPMPPLPITHQDLSVSRRSTFVDGAPKIQISLAHSTFTRSNSTSQIPLLVSAQDDSDFSSNCASSVAGCDIGSKSGRGIKRVRIKSDEANEDLEKNSGETGISVLEAGQRPVKRLKMLYHT
ncbi:hypothetical protein L218DRAFT_1075492 [Marasmius fiardii PR-910]|nr:hypothetical protein L218DRAFT_1075492 [Marasmius fiardii PR-910]